MDETKEAAGAEECRNRNHVQLLPAASPPTPCRFRALPLDAVRLDVTREHRACRLRARRQLASRPALIPLPGSSRTA
eukprot:COSAG06_NODE_1905_length_8095_cov_10.218984_2_plen_77_part_00